ncbi:hypothetical protein ACEPAF_9453 [Sanghuangporus sanghuang]
MVDDYYINTTFGAALMGLIVGSVLYGLTCMQTFLYYRAYSKDPIGLKLLVFALWILDSTHMVLSTVAIYWYLILNFGNFENLDVGYWAMDIQTDCNGLIGLMVELFFAWRVWKVSNSIWLISFITVLAFLHFSLGIYFTVEGFRLGRFSKYSELTWVTCVGLGSAAACDMTIAISLVYYLLRSRTGFKQSDSIISTLVMYAINTGLFTGVCAAAATICFAFMPTNFVWLAFFWCLGKLYVNSLLASLNSRQALRKIAENRDVRASMNLPRLSTYMEFERPRRGKRRTSSNSSIPGPFSAIEIVVDTTREQKSDYEPTPNPNLTPTASSGNTHTLSKIESVSESSSPQGHKVPRLILSGIISSFFYLTDLFAYDILRSIASTLIVDRATTAFFSLTRIPSFCLHLAEWVFVTMDFVIM